MQKGVYRKLNLVNLSEEVSLKFDNLLLKCTRFVFSINCHIYNDSN